MQSKLLTLLTSLFALSTTAIALQPVTVKAMEVNAHYCAGYSATGHYRMAYSRSSQQHACQQLLQGFTLNGLSPMAYSAGSYNTVDRHSIELSCNNGNHYEGWFTANPWKAFELANTQGPEMCLIYIR